MTSVGSRPSAVMLVDKPAGCTSFDVVREVRRGARTKVGHAGTLDPFATGLLLVLAGQATRLSELLMNLPKEYVTEAQFGFVSSTQDSTGVLIDTESARVTSLQVNAALDQFRGDIRQRVPLTSAVKVDGEPLYKRAHRGETAERPVREVKVYDLSMTRFDQERQVATIVARTGKGTYVRTIVHELGKALETGAYAAALRRTRSGVFNVHDSRPPADIKRVWEAGGAGEGVLSVPQALSFLPRIEVSGKEAVRAKNGNELLTGPQGRFCVFGPDGLLAVYARKPGAESDPARPLVVFPEPEAR